MRKDLLRSSLQKVADQKAGVSDEPPEPIRAIPSVKAVQRGLEDLAAIEAKEIHPDDIAESSIKDRLNLDEDIDTLVESIQSSGQKLPILVRRLSEGDKKYEVVYGRRRMEACRRLGVPVRANVVNMGQREAFISQGLENAARLERSFIEQALYARMLERNDFNRKEVTEILAINSFSLSRMMSVVSYVPDSVIEAIGPAHDAGRRPWWTLRDWFENAGAGAAEKALELIDPNLPSTDRLKALLKAVADKPKNAKMEPVKRQIGSGRLGIQRDQRKLSVQIKGADDDGLLRYIDERLDALYQEYMEKEAKKPDQAE